MTPVGIDHDMGFVVVDQPVPVAGEAPQADFRIATAGYFGVTGVPIRSGRDLSELDRDGAPRVMIVNETMARLAFPDGRVLGRKVRTGGFDFEVVGIAADVRHRGLELSPRPEMFVAEPQIYSYGTMNVVVRARNATGAVAAIKHAVAAIDPDKPLGPIATKRERISDSVSRRRFNLVVLSLFAGVGLLLAGIGIYGVISYTVGQRTREIGIRAALGAGSGSLTRMVLGSGFRLALIGVLAGFLGALALTRLLRSQLFDLSPLDPVSLLGTGLLLFGAALLASWLPARQAVKVDPCSALRQE
jgi:predicted permease